MSTYCKRAQVLFTEEQYRLLSKLAQTVQKSMGTIIRESIEKELIELKRQKRKEAAERICSKNLPTIEWEEFEKELVKAHTPCDILAEEANI
ncbi:MAG: hypothetical protein AAB267_10360 [Candidatus Desantisbacteria bacterium]